MEGIIFPSLPSCAISGPATQTWTFQVDKEHFIFTTDPKRTRHIQINIRIVDFCLFFVSLFVQQMEAGSWTFSNDDDDGDDDAGDCWLSIWTESAPSLVSIDWEVIHLIIANISHWSWVVVFGCIWWDCVHPFFGYISHLPKEAQVPLVGLCRGVIQGHRRISEINSCHVDIVLWHIVWSKNTNSSSLLSAEMPNLFDRTYCSTGASYGDGFVVKPFHNSHFILIIRFLTRPQSCFICGIWHL